MYERRNLQYINLPEIPTVIVQRYLDAVHSVEAKYTNGGYIWSDSNNELLNNWCQRYICKDIYWGVQLMTEDLPVHVDEGTTLKFVYLFQTGGDEVKTHFWQDGEIQETYVIPTNQWHTLKVDTEHSVVGIQPRERRISVTGRIF